MVRIMVIAGKRNWVPRRDNVAYIVLQRASLAEDSLR